MSIPDSMLIDTFTTCTKRQGTVVQMSSVELKTLSHTLCSECEVPFASYESVSMKVSFTSKAKPGILSVVPHAEMELTAILPEK